MFEAGIDLEGNCFAMGSMPPSSSENSYDGSTIFREKVREAGACFDAVFFRGSVKKVVCTSSEELWGLGFLWEGDCFDPEAVRVADELGFWGSCTSVLASGPWLETN
jgi:hypothetical protein